METCDECGEDLEYQIDGHTYEYTIGIEVPGVYDGVLFWMCPFCRYQWPRFLSGHLHEAGKKYIAKGLK